MSTDSQSAKFVQFVADIGATYQHYPIFGDIADQAFANSSSTGRIQPQIWAFEGDFVPTNFFTVSTTTYPKSGFTLMQPVRSPNHPGNFPTVIPETWDADKSPQVASYIGELTALLTAANATFRFGVTYTYWAPRDRVSAQAYAELPVRGT